MSNPYEKIFDEDPTSGGNGKHGKLMHGLYDLSYNHHQRPRFRRAFLLFSSMVVSVLLVRKLALDDPVVNLAMEQMKEEEEKRQKIIDSGLNYPISFDL